MPGGQKFIAASGTAMLENLTKVRDDIETMKTKLKTGEADQHEVVAAALRSFQELVGVVEPLVKAYKRVNP